MTAEESTFFILLDNYSRTQHNCFLAEMFLNLEKTEYVLCFRPNTGAAASCRYLRIGVNSASVAAREGKLSSGMLDLLNRELASLANPIRS